MRHFNVIHSCMSSGTECDNEIWKVNCSIRTDSTCAKTRQTFDGVYFLLRQIHAVVTFRNMATRAPALPLARQFCPKQRSHFTAHMVGCRGEMCIVTKYTTKLAKLFDKKDFQESMCVLLPERNSLEAEIWLAPGNLLETNINHPVVSWKRILKGALHAMRGRMPWHLTQRVYLSPKNILRFTWNLRTVWWSGAIDIWSRNQNG